MPISGLVLTLSDEPSLQQAALSQLALDSRLSLGELQVNRLPVVAETDTIRQSTRLVREELLTIPGVIFVDVVMVDFSDTPATDESVVEPTTHKTHDRPDARPPD